MRRITRLKRHILRVAGGRRFQFDWVLEQELSAQDIASLLSLKAEDVVSGKHAKLVRGRERRCHSNTAKLVENNPELCYCTGLALSRDGIWRVHSWALEAKKKLVLETTEIRIKYFGYSFKKGAIPAFAQS